MFQSASRTRSLSLYDLPFSAFSQQLSEHLATPGESSRYPQRTLQVH